MKRSKTVGSVSSDGTATDSSAMSSTDMDEEKPKTIKVKVPVESYLPE